jgi:hypothetical protein
LNLEPLRTTDVWKVRKWSSWRWRQFHWRKWDDKNSRMSGHVSISWSGLGSSSWSGSELLCSSRLAHSKPHSAWGGNISQEYQQKRK